MEYKFKEGLLYVFLESGYVNANRDICSCGDIFKATRSDNYFYWRQDNANAGSNDARLATGLEVEFYNRGGTNIYKQNYKSVGKIFKFRWNWSVGHDIIAYCKEDSLDVIKCDKYYNLTRGEVSGKGTEEVVLHKRNSKSNRNIF